MAIPESVRLKLAWSKENFKVFHNTGTRYFDGAMGEIMADCSGHANAIFAPPLPWELPFLIGDCLQNLRSSLDYLVRELGIVKGNANEHAAFPVCKKPSAFKDRHVQGQIAGLDDTMLTVIKGFQPFHAGKDWGKTDLWLLHEFCNMHKHRAIQFTRVSVTDSRVGTTKPIANGDADVPDMEVNNDLTAFISFQDGPVKGREVSRFTSGLIAFVEHVVLPEFERFF